jgi:hypothetical protein
MATKPRRVLRTVSARQRVAHDPNAGHSLTAIRQAMARDRVRPGLPTSGRRLMDAAGALHEAMACGSWKVGMRQRTRHPWYKEEARIRQL